ncbi:hypothetical protein N658DRAFT_207565 [Parathielavia hyrcaniae]|uniref:Uncharacterized protein n=1 Tax=Parathielavia hyrcaniae TaxID=113614 RepID=A0AAN6SZ97_9PEZI|nr:hypothetical protein N658DRAFT_207565 [Parathielavia hyrcaniae]
MVTTDPSATATATATADGNPWDEIEQNYFNSMRAHRDDEDRALESEFRARGEELRQQVLKNYNAQAELLRRLQELKSDYDAMQAALDGLDGDLERARREKAREREAEDERRREWFLNFKSGLAYRTMEEEEGVPLAAGELVDGGVHVNGREEGQQSLGAKVQEEMEGMVTGDDDGSAANLNWSTDDEQPSRQLSEEDSEVDLPDAQSPPNRLDDEAQPPQPPADTEKLPNGHHQDGEEQDQPADDNEEPTRTAPFVHSHEQATETMGPTELMESDITDSDAQQAADRREEEPPAMETQNSQTQVLSETQQQQETVTPTLDRDMTEVHTPVDDKDVEGVTVIGDPEFPEKVPVPDTEVKPNLEPPANLSAPSTDQEVQHAGVTAARASSPSLGLPEGEQPGNSAPSGEEDMEMADVQASTESNKDDPEPPNVPSQTMPAAPVSPSSSSSSELSSRHTTPVLESPVSMPGEPSPPATSAGAMSGAIEVLDGSGESIGWLQAPDISHALVDRLQERPVKRPVEIREGRKFTADDLETVPRPHSIDGRAYKFLSFFVQATGDIQERPCLDCSTNHGLYQTCVAIPDDPDFTRCGNCEWNRRRCHPAAPERPSSSRHSLSTAKSPIKSPTSVRAPGGSFTAVNDRGDGEDQTEGAASNTKDEPDIGKEAPAAVRKKAPRKSLPSTRKAPMPETPTAGSIQSESDDPPEITKEILCLRDDGVVYTDPPMMRGVPLAKISPDHPYWEPDWKPIEELIEPIRHKHQERFEQLEQAGSTNREKHLANRDAKRGRVVLQYLKEGGLHPYQLVGKDWINYRIANYDTLFRLVQLLTDELPKMNLDVEPSEWLRHRLWEVCEEKGGKFDVANWIAKAYHDPKIEHLRQKFGFARVGRPPAHATKQAAEPATSSKKSAGSRSLKRKDPHETPEATPSKSKANGTSKPSPVAAAAPAAATEQQQQPKHKKIRIITTGQSQAGGSGSSSSSEREPGLPSSRKPPKIILSSPFTPSAPAAAAVASASSSDKQTLDSALEHDGYTSSDSVSHDQLHFNDWRLHQVRTRTFATNPLVTQYWHWVTETKEKKNSKEIEHQVLEWVEPPRWAVFKKPYNFHLKLDDIQEVKFAAAGRGRCTKVLVVHKQGKDGKDTHPRGDLMAQFKRDRTKRRFLTFLRHKGVRVVEVGIDIIESRWESISPKTLPVHSE